jgi:hypothetical protein
MTIERPPTSSVPPELPPFLTKRRGGGRPRRIIMPSMMHVEQVMRLPDREENWYTLIYRWMMRWDLEANEAELTVTSTRRYRQWLETYETDDGIPPHICFGGAIEAGAPDPTFHSRWKKYAQETFV